jgi:hypothetical protein
MVEEKTAIIVNELGAVFTGWDPYPRFCNPIKAVAGHFRPFGIEDGQEYWIYPPQVFSSVRSAEKTAEKIRTYPHYRIKFQIAVVS